MLNDYNDVPDILASRLNFDVIVFRGNTRKEMLFIGLASVLITMVVLGVLAQCFLGMFLIGVGLSFPTAIPVGWGAATVMQKWKDGKPKGYVKQQFQLWMDKKGIKSAPYIRYSGKWSVKRFFK